MESNESWNQIKVSPREVELRKLRDSKEAVHFLLMTDDAIDGQVVWFDDAAIHVLKTDGSEVTVMLNVISTYSKLK
jgi:hypothetical protein